MKTIIKGSNLYQEAMSYYESDSHSNSELQHRVWDKTPWMVDIYTGSLSDDRSKEIREWCSDKFGPESWPIHGKDGCWHFGGATVYGWTWVGFSRRDQLSEFCDKWDDTSKTQ